MRLSLNMTDFSWPDGPAAITAHVGQVAEAADASRLDTLWLGDHLLQADPTSHPGAPMLEAGTTLGFLAARTRRIRLGTMVAAATFRPAALLVKAVTTLDVLSSGRAWLGIGAGHHRDEATDLGLPMPARDERFALLDDTLALARQMWHGDRRPFEGTRVRARSPISEPPPLQQPRPPILVGGMGERRTLRLVARHADACNLFDLPDGGETLRHKLAVLDAHCDDIGRPRESVERTVSTRLGNDESVGAFVDRCHGLADLGIDHVVAIRSGPWTPASVDVLARAADQLADLPTNDRHGARWHRTVRHRSSHG